MNIKIRNIFIFVIQLLQFNQSFIFSFSGIFHLRSTTDLIEKCRTEHQKPFSDFTEEEIKYILFPDIVLLFYLNLL